MGKKIPEKVVSGIETDNVIRFLVLYALLRQGSILEK